MVLECQGERCGDCVANNAAVYRKPAQSISFDHVSGHHRDTFKSICSFANVTDFRRASGRAGLTMITKVHFVFVEELPGCLTY